MFGYFVCTRDKLEKEEIGRYQSMYCGLCKTLEKRFGQLSRMSVNYEMTFLTLFLSSMYEPEEQKTEFRCGIHPTHKRTASVNLYTEYAADLTVALAYYKCLDDWQDEKKHLQYQYSRLLKKGYHEVEKRYPRQCTALKEGLAQLSELEVSRDSGPDAAVNCFGRILSEIFVYEEDFWSGSMRSIGYDLGRFLYLMDATMDYKKDMKTGNYNPLVQMNKKPEEMESILGMMIGGAAQEFEKLPVVQDGHLLRNIIYSGVWQKYYAEMKREEKHHGR